MRQGKILYAGSSNFAGWHIAQAQAAAASRHFTGLVSEQSIYNLIAQRHRARGHPGRAALRPRRHALVAAARRAARRGAAQGARGQAPPRGPIGTRPSGPPRRRSRQYEDFADELGLEPGDVALAWLLHQPAVTAPIVGPRTMEQLKSAERALDVELDDSLLGQAGRDLPRPQDRARGLRLVSLAIG